MYWHAEISALILRGYFEPGGYEAQRPFAAVVGAQLLGQQAAFLAGGLAVNGQPLTPGDWRDLARKLRVDYQIQTIEAIRGTDRERVSWPTGRAR